jgi:Protein of unknown function (DUF3750)
MTAVELWSAKIPGLFSFAEHHWFVIRDNGQVDRWEIWQRKNVGGSSWGHLHKNLIYPEGGVGNGPGQQLCQWQDEAALHLKSKIEDSPETYPWSSRYLVWPGPNSNTYVQWVLAQYYSLGWRGFGKAYSRLC